jgi:hypothetical protein
VLPLAFANLFVISFFSFSVSSLDVVPDVVPAELWSQLLCYPKTKAALHATGRSVQGRY